MDSVTYRETVTEILTVRQLRDAKGQPMDFC